MYTTKRNYGIFPRTITGMMDDVIQNGWGRLNEEIMSLNAPVNIRESESSYDLSLVAPGLQKEDFRIQVEKGILSITYDHKEETEQKNEGRWIRTEFKSRSFKRSFSLGEETDATHVSARYQDGILYLNIPKKSKIPVETRDIHVA
jgi:HSP20 family protein